MKPVKKRTKTVRCPDQFIIRLKLMVSQRNMKSRPIFIIIRNKGKIAADTGLGNSNLATLSGTLVLSFSLPASRYYLPSTTHVYHGLVRYTGE
jgi:hypothetical protein